MKVLVFNDNNALAEFAASEMIELLKKKPAAVICLASGDSPKLTCELFVKKATTEKINLESFIFIGLDEWVGLSPKTKGSCESDFQNRLFDPLGIRPSQYHLFDGLSNNLEKECADMDAFIKKKGGIDLMVVGIGMNGHIGFNEPGVDFNLLSHVIDLDETTVSVGQKYFSEPVSLQKGITLGLGHLMNSKKLLLLANGKRKSMVIKKAVEETISNLFPASIVQQHPESYVLIDEDAGSLLDKSKIK